VISVRRRGFSTTRTPIPADGISVLGRLVGVSGTSPGTVAGLADYYNLDPHRFIAGDATGTGNGLSESSPWTWNQMLSNATPGMIIGALGGVFSRASTGARDVPSFNIPSGVTIVCKRAAAYNTAGITEFRNGVTTGDNGCPTLGANGRSNTRWIGAYVDENVSRSKADTGPVVCWNSTGSEFHGLVISGASIPRVDNHNLFRVEQSADWLLKNSVLHGCKRSTSPDQNHAAVMTYDSLGGVIDHCEFDDNDYHIFYKGDHEGVAYPNGGVETRYSKFTNALLGWIHLGGNNSHPSLTQSKHRYNLILTAPRGVYFHSFGSATVDGHPNDNLFEHNTFVDVPNPWYWGWGAGALPYAHNIQILRNLMVTGTRVHDFVELQNSDVARVIANGCLSDENHVHGYAQFGNVGGAAQTIAQWQSLTQSLGERWEGSTTSGDPLLLADYRLAPGSPAAGKGCYVTGDEAIGLER
jgi:hypothetical protein